MDRPKLRKVDRIELDRHGEPLMVLRDPLGISTPIALNAQFAVVLDRFDGRHSLAQIRQSLLLGNGLDVPVEDLADLAAELSREGLLDDDCFRERWAQEHAAFLAEPVRGPRHAGTLYPDHRGELEALLERTFGNTPRVQADTDVIGVLCPHVPLENGGAIYAKTLRDLPPAADVERVVVLGTDHHPGLLPYVATTKHYATPLGVSKTDTRFVHDLQRRLPWLTREEVRHRDGRTIELAVLCLQKIYGSDCPPIVPILCGPTALDPTRDDVESFMGVMEALCEQRPILWWTSAELSHAGPAYGRPSLSQHDLSAIEDRDEACLFAVSAGSPDRLVRRCSEAHPLGRPSGGAALTTLVRLLPVGYRTRRTAYELLAAPGAQPGWIGAAGLQLLRPP